MPFIAEANIIVDAICQTKTLTPNNTVRAKMAEVKKLRREKNANSIRTIMGVIATKLISTIFIVSRFQQRARLN